MAPRRIPVSAHPAIVSAYRMGASQVEIAARWGITQARVCQILKQNNVHKTDRIRGAGSRGMSS